MLSAVFESFPSILFSWYLTFFFWHAQFLIWNFYGVRKYLGTDFFIYFFILTKIKHCNVGSCNKMLGNAMYFVAWYTLPFFRETKFIFSINLSCFFCFRSRMPLESSCQSLPGPGSPARSWLPSLPSGAWLDWWAWRSWCGGSWPSWRNQWPLSRKFLFL